MAQINLGHVVGQGVPSGGTAGQILKKNGSTNFDTSWTTLDGSMVPVSAGDSTTVQQSLAAVKSDMGIVEDGNTATHTIAAGQYVIWKGALYTASAAIPAGTTLSTSNLTAVSGGGLNALNGKLIRTNITSITITDIVSGVTIDSDYRFANIWGNSVHLFLIIRVSTEIQTWTEICTINDARLLPTTQQRVLIGSRVGYINANGKLSCQESLPTGTYACQINYFLN